MLSFNSILIFSENPKELVDFYKKVFDKDPDWSEENYSTFAIGMGGITIGPHDKVHGQSQNPERIMFNLEADDVQSEFDRIKALGVKVIAEPYQPGEMEDGDLEYWIATFADPDGNFFQIMTPMKMD